jgi:hypothetical protein
MGSLREQCNGKFLFEYLLYSFYIANFVITTISNIYLLPDVRLEKAYVDFIYYTKVKENKKGYQCKTENTNISEIICVNIDRA